MKRWICGIVLLILMLLLLNFNGSALWKINGPEASSSVSFREVWGYLMMGEEKAFKGDEPLTDLFYFSCGLNSKGRINMNVAPPKLPLVDGRKRRVHLVISELRSRELTHVVLSPDIGIRDYLIDDILELASRFDGIQIDFEAVSGRDGADFIRFLELVKMGLDEGKVFSVALPPRKSRVPGDAYDYRKISRIADRVYIMAYDQHWSTSKPGPVASLSWCRGIVRYAKSVIPSDRLVMGIPLYGRAWYDGNNSCVISANHINAMMYKTKVVREYSPDTGLKLTYGNSSDVTVYYDDIKATREKFFLYRGYVDSVGFWRLGMENRGVWREIAIRE